MYLEIGQTAVIDGKKIKCVEDDSETDSCSSCIFYNYGGFPACSANGLECVDEYRLDSKYVHFILDEEA